MSEKIIFVADTHFKYHNLDKNERKKRQLFLHFLRDLENVERIYLLGDIFDFWFEKNNHTPPYYRDILKGFQSVVNRGIEIYMMGGNHDYWLGSYLPLNLGIKILPPMVTTELQGRTITMTHGDMLMPGDYAYKMLKTVIRSKPVISLACIIPTGLLYKFASRFSRTSKSITSGTTENSVRKITAIAGESLFRWGNDTFIMGHIHYPLSKEIEGKDFMILGDWEEHYSFGCLENGQLQMKYYSPGPTTVRENL